MQLIAFQNTICLGASSGDEQSHSRELWRLCMEFVCALMMAKEGDIEIEVAKHTAKSTTGEMMGAVFCDANYRPLQPLPKDAQACQGN